MGQAAHRHHADQRRDADADAEQHQEQLRQRRVGQAVRAAHDAIEARPHRVGHERLGDELPEQAAAPRGKDLIEKQKQRRRDEQSHVQRRVVQKWLALPGERLPQHAEHHHRHPRDHQDHGHLAAQAGQMRGDLEAPQRTTLADAKVAERLFIRHLASW